MNASLKNVFVNPELAYLRSGWRIGIFLVIMTACSFLITAPGIYLLKIFPMLNSSGTQLFFVYAGVTAATWITLRFVDKRPFISIGLTFRAPAAKELSIGLLFGAGMMSLIFAIEFVSGMVHIEFRSLTVQQQLGIFFNSAFLYIVVGYGEELLFRGYILQVLAEGTTRLISALFFGVLFAFAHAKNPNASLFGLINVGLAGIWLAAAYYKTNALWLPIGMHISWNFFQGFVFGFPVSGTTSETEQISKAVQTGAEWITGGTFGPEGGALATAMLVISTAVIYFSPWVTSSASAWQYSTWRVTRKNEIAERTMNRTELNPGTP
ncbi:MAG: type II CAAX endopeptidase family protein [Bacteroidota bacterium]|jgi:hypothetical protein